MMFRSVNHSSFVAGLVIREVAGRVVMILRRRARTLSTPIVRAVGKSPS